MTHSQTNMNIWAVTVAVAGLLFGFDTAVISGADLPLQKLWQTSSLVHGFFVMSSALWGTVLGALAGNIPCDRLGRRKTLVVIGVLYFLSAVGSALANDPYVFSLMRFIGGVGVGISSIVAPAYISEIAPANKRGRMVALYQFQIVLGILVAFVSNYFLQAMGFDWRVMLGSEAIPALIFIILVIKVPESPRWLYLHCGEVEKAREILVLAGENDPDKVLAEIEAESHTHGESLLVKKFYWPISLAFLIALFNQLSGINFIIYFAPRVFELAGLGSSIALLSSSGIGLINLIFTMLGMYLIDNVGRKRLMYIGSLGYILSLSVIAWAFEKNVGGMVVVSFVFVFIASHAIGQGAVIWVFISEIFPNSVRTKGQSLGSGTHWVLAALISLLMPLVLETFAAATVFSGFAIMMVLQLIWVHYWMPETKGISLEELSYQLERH